MVIPISTRAHLSIHLLALALAFGARARARARLRVSIEVRANPNLVRQVAALLMAVLREDGLHLGRVRVRVS